MPESKKNQVGDQFRQYIMIKIKQCFPKCRTRELLDQNQ